ncbi:F-type type IV conjugative transfer system protein TraB (plasmid) [Aliarcobacter cibarius]|nr:F-type type IV conjugative transfer system protein TraB [Aliarcobacter cibarius]
MLAKFKSEKLKSFIFMATLTVLLITVVMISSALVSDVATQDDSKKKAVSDVVIQYDNAVKIEENSFKQTYGDKLNMLEQNNQELSKNIAEIMSMLSEQKQIPSINSFTNDTAPQVNQNQAFSNFEPPKVEEPKPIKTVPVTSTLTIIADPIKEEKKEEVKDKETKKPKQIIVPAGSFVKGRLLNGLDAPSSGAAKSSPHPVAIQIIDKSILPNKFRADIKDCVAIGSGYGELSSDRAILRVENLSCVKKDGTSITSKGSSIGYVTGEDGKIGLSGRVVSKQGAILARALVAGFAEGMAKVFTQSNTYVATSANGTVSTPEPNKAFESSMYGGAAEASKKVAEYYLKLNDEMFPIVEIAVGRKCDIIFTKPIIFEEVKSE